MHLTTQTITQLLHTIVDPNTGKDLVSSKAIKNIIVDGSEVNLDVELAYPALSQTSLIRNLVDNALSKAGASKIIVNVSSRIIAHSVQRGLTPMSNIKNIIAVASGKGGVGKSTTAVNLALALAAEGARVGVLDADIYGPSQPMMLGLSGKPPSLDGKSMEPLIHYGIQANSIGLLVETDTPMVLRGPMISSYLTELLTKTHWQDLDYLVVDMPPGTGDVHLTLSQKVPVTGAVIVTTPQDIALLDAKRGIQMFEKVGIPVLGIIENMSLYRCSHCGHIEHIFGQGGGEKIAAQYKVEYLGGLPLDISIRLQADSGKPTVVAEPNGEIANLYKTIARRIAIKIAERPKDTSKIIPKIVVSKDK